MKRYLAFMLFLLPLLVTAQQDDYYQKQPRPAKQTGRPVYTIVLKDGTELRGEVLRQDSVEAVIRTRNLGEVRLRADQIIRIEQQDVRGETGGTYANLFPQTMRLSPTAFQAEKGRVYFRNYVFYVSQFEYGITDNWSVGTSFFTVVPTSAFSLNTKLSVPVSGRVRMGINAQYAAVRSDGLIINSSRGSLEGIGYVQGIVTTGDRQNNTTYGIGATVSNGRVSRNLIGTLGLVRKVNSNLTFISENFVLFGSGVSRTVSFAGVLSSGVRFDRRRHAFDVAAYLPVIIGNNWRGPVRLIPFGSYHLRIGK